MRKDAISLKSADKSRKILVVGDVMLDMYYAGTINRISPEAPVPVLRKQNEYSLLGGAANVANNLVAANQKTSIMAVTGDDVAAQVLLTMMDQSGIDARLYRDHTRPTTTKIRFLAENNQQVLRMDEEDAREIPSGIVREMLEALEENIGEYDLIVISDYMKGLLTDKLTQGIIESAGRHQLKVIVDVKDANCEKYKNSYLIKPNLKELNMLTNMPVDTEEHIIAACRYLLEKTCAKFILVTRGADGMLLVDEDETFSCPAVRQEVFDVTGAGDTSIAYLGACLANGMDIRDAVRYANCAAGIQVSKMGTSAVRCREVDALFNNVCAGKRMSADEIREFREDFQGKRIVFTNGCFDILHVGHIRYLESARKLGDVLIVGINSDASVKRLKGQSRPINELNDRMELLEALECVDRVIAFEEDTPYELIKQIRPDILVKGGDYLAEDVIGRDIVEADGGRVVILPFVEGKSTTGVIQKAHDINAKAKTQNGR